MSSFAEESPPLPDLFLIREAATQSIRPIPLAPHSDGLQDFRLRLEKAIVSHHGVAIQALYQTNQVSAAELKLELDRWKQVIDGDGKGGLSLVYKELTYLPPKSHEFWDAKAHRVTTHDVDAFVMVRINQTPIFQLILPLIAVDSKLLIVVSDKSKND